MTVINPYLTFNGNCEEAFDYYRKIFGGEFTYIGRFSDMPEKQQINLSDEEKKHIMHVSLPISKETILMGSDAMPGYNEKCVPGTAVSLSITVRTKKEADRIYNLLGEGGEKVVPMGKTFWGAYYGLVEDKFGFNWMISSFKSD